MPDAPEPYDDPGPLARTVVRLVAHGVHLLSSLLGDDVAGRRIRVLLLRAAGAQLGPRVTVHGGTYITRPRHLAIGAGSFVNRGCYLDLEATLEIGTNVTVGHGVTFITTHHELGPHDKRCGDFGGLPIRVGDGAWLGANVTVMPGVVIGDGAVVAAGAVVLHDVPADVMVAGVPASAQRALP